MREVASNCFQREQTESAKILENIVTWKKELYGKEGGGYIFI